MSKENKISLEVLNELPPGKPICIEDIEVGGTMVRAIKWMWLDKAFSGHTELKTAHFNLETGEYLGEA